MPRDLPTEVGLNGGVLQGAYPLIKALQIKMISRVARNMGATGKIVEPILTYLLPIAPRDD
jgi:hypothetical protein